MRTRARWSSKSTPARPITATRRPQFGSAPWIAVFTSGEFATARAACFASASVRPPRTSMVTNLVAPSPPRTMPMANGASGVAIGEHDLPMLIEALTRVCEPLAIGIVRGGEGATKLVTIEVRGGRTDAEAKQAARAVANSPLVKTAIHGADPNWGRLVAVMGRAGVDFSLERARVQIGNVLLFSEG